MVEVMDGAILAVWAIGVAAIYYGWAEKCLPSNSWVQERWGTMKAMNQDPKYRWVIRVMVVLWPAVLLSAYLDHREAEFMAEEDRERD